MRSVTFSGGAALQKKLRDIMIKVGRDNIVKVGFLEGATYKDGTPVAMVAAIQNFGAPAAGIPARPFFTNMVNEESGGWGKSLGKAAVSNDYNIEKTLGTMGENIGSQLQDSIVATNAPALTEATILARARGSKRGRIKSATIAKPLIATGEMLNTVAYQVDEGDQVKLKRRK